MTALMEKGKGEDVFVHFHTALWSLHGRVQIQSYFQLPCTEDHSCAQVRGSSPIFGLKLKIKVICAVAARRCTFFSEKNSCKTDGPPNHTSLRLADNSMFPTPLTDAPPAHPCEDRRPSHTGSPAKRPRLHIHYHRGRVQTRAFCTGTSTRRAATCTRVGWMGINEGGGGNMELSASRREV